jgi:2-hydroxycyclohexanecarboxyl-CoA dehydrogenase
VRLQGKTAMVTGAGRGIGEAIADALAAEGAAVAACDLDGAAAAKVAVGLTERHGGRAAGVPADIADGASVRAAVGLATSELGPIDILVNNAGIDVVELFVDSAEETWDRGRRTAGPGGRQAPGRPGPRPGPGGGDRL